MAGPPDEGHEPTTHDPETVRLLTESRSGSREALDALLQRCLPGLRAFVRLRLGPVLRALESESDLVQTVCAELLQRLDDFEYRGEAQFRQWLYTTALNKIRQRRRHHGTQKRGGGMARHPLDETLLLNSYAAVCSPSHHAVLKEQVDLLERAFDRLPEHYREVLTLSRIAGLSQEETAAHMGRSVPSTRNLLNRAMVKLAAELSELRRD